MGNLATMRSALFIASLSVLQNCQHGLAAGDEGATLAARAVAADGSPRPELALTEPAEGVAKTAPTREECALFSAQDEARLLLDWRDSYVTAEFWAEISEWGDPEDVCNTWEGVSCSGNRISQIALNDGAAAGPLPTSLSCLEELTTLNLAGNSFTGPLPPDWSALRKLLLLDVSSNALTGGLPPDYSTLAALHVAAATSAGLSGTIPDSWAAMTALQELLLGNNALSGEAVPAWVVSLESLQALEVGGGKLTHSPLAFSTAVSRFPPSLRSIILPGSGLAGTFSSELAENLPQQLTALDLSNNLLKGPLPEPATPLLLENLDLGGNGFTGTLPTSWSSSLAALANLGLSGNPLSGSLQDEWSSLAALRSVDVSDIGRLSGSLPAAWSELGSSLREFKASGSSVSGTLPAAWSALSSLECLLANSASLTGTLPAEYSTWQHLEQLQISANGLTGSLPPQWSVASKLKDLQLRQNRLSGSLPPQYSEFRRVENFLLWVNELTGTLPSQYSTFTNVALLSVRTNRLRGTIPEGWMYFPKVKKLLFSDNQLTGTIPQSMGNLSSLSDYLWWGENDLTGTIPETISALTQLRVLHLHSTRITGNVPAGIGNMAALQDISLDNNRLQGTVPAELGALGRLETLRLDGNNLSGSLPAELSNLTGVMVLSLCSPASDMSHCRGSCSPSNTENRFCWPQPIPFIPASELDVSCFSDLCPDTTLPGLDGDGDAQNREPVSTAAIVIAVLAAAAFAAIVAGLLAVYILRRNKRNQLRFSAPDIEVGESSHGSSQDPSVYSSLVMKAQSLLAPSKQAQPAAPLLLSSQPAASRALQDQGVVLDATDVKLLNRVAVSLGPNAARILFTRLQSDRGVGSGGGSLQTTALGIREGPTDYQQQYGGGSEGPSFGGSTSTLSSTRTRPYSSYDAASLSVASSKTYLTQGADGEAADVGGVDLNICFEREVEPHLTLRLGSGAFGDVYLGRYRGKKVAVKLLSKAFQGASRDQYRTFRHEVSLLASLQHCPHIVKMMGACLSRPNFCIVYEWLPRSVGERLYDKTLPQLTYLEILRIGRDVAEGLEYLHPTVIHRDLKPQNILLDEEGRAKIIDFGISRTKSPFDTYVKTETGGTPGYMAPEVFDGQGRISEKCDIYSLGIILCELVACETGWPPEEYWHVAQIIVAVLNHQKRPRIPEACPPELSRLITKCWDPEPMRRPSATEVKRQLQFMIDFDLEGGSSQHCHLVPPSPSAASTACDLASAAPTPQPLPESARQTSEWLYEQCPIGRSFENSSAPFSD